MGKRFLSPQNASGSALGPMPPPNQWISRDYYTWCKAAGAWIWPMPLQIYKVTYNNTQACVWISWSYNIERTLKTLFLALDSHFFFFFKEKCENSRFVLSDGCTNVDQHELLVLALQVSYFLFVDYCNKPGTTAVFIRCRLRTRDRDKKSSAQTVTVRPKQCRAEHPQEDGLGTCSKSGTP
jgi:hypothetical protein